MSDASQGDGSQPVSSLAWFNFRQTVAFLVLSVFCTVTLLWIFYHPPLSEQAEKIANLLLGGLISITTTAINYIFRGSGA